MIKPIIIIIFLLIGMFGTVLVVQKSTLMQSFGYDVMDFMSSFHAAEGDAEFNPNLDTYKDGMINTLDVLTDRYKQEATRAGEASNSSGLNNVTDELNEVEISSGSAEENSGSEI